MMLHHARRRAVQKKLSCTITTEWIVERLGRCEATGIEFDFSPQRVGRNPFAPSLDRRDGTKGYTPENTQVVVWIHNAARNEWGTEALHEYIRKYLKYLMKKAHS